jgi:hypothetical protein
MEKKLFLTTTTVIEISMGIMLVFNKTDCLCNDFHDSSQRILNSTE